ncbi:hypothetical protein ACFL5K_00060 [Gemmatimonadota bacterium]
MNSADSGQAGDISLMFNNICEILKSNKYEPVQFIMINLLEPLNIKSDGKSEDFPLFWFS